MCEEAYKIMANIKYSTSYLFLDRTQKELIKRYMNRYEKAQTTKSNELKDLKPCPFCGAEAEFIKYDTGDSRWTENEYMVRCTGKAMHMLDHIGSKAELLGVWNTRSGNV